MSEVLRTSSCSGRNTCADDGGHRAFDWRCDIFKYVDCGDSSAAVIGANGAEKFTVIKVLKHSSWLTT